MPISRRNFLKGLAGAAAGLPLAAAGYGFGVEPAWLEVTETDVVLPGLAPAFDGFRIALVSDLHYGGYLPLARLQRVVRTVNALDADLIALTGDFVSHPRTAVYLAARVQGLPKFELADAPAAEATFGVCIPEIAGMRAREGALAVLGNHDHWLDATVARRSLAAHGIELVENRHRLLARGGRQLVVAGVDDLWTGRQDLPAAFAGAPPADQAPRLLLCHNPDFAMDPGLPHHGVRLMLCGHTHGGQVCLPGLGAPVLPIRHKQFARGLVATAWGHVYITRGIGQTTPPVRLLARPEVAVIRLRS